MHFRKKPVMVQAWEITPHLFELAFAQQMPELLGVTFHVDQSGQYVTMHSELSNASRGELGDWIVRTTAGKLGIYPRAVFEASYDIVPPTLTLEQEIQAKGLTAPRITPDDIERVIERAEYFTAADAFRFGWLTADHQDRDTREMVGRVANSLQTSSYSSSSSNIDIHADTPQSLKLLTICVLTLRNGFTVVGTSACASPENFDAAVGRKAARNNAVQHIWPLEGYLLKQRLYMGEQFAIAGGISEEKRAELQALDDAHRIERIAKTCHEINRAYCASLGDLSQPAWEDAPQWQRDSAVNGVKFHLANPAAGPDASHNAWLEEKRAAGWSYGPAKNPELLQHPCFVPYEELPREQQAKDYLFRATVHQFAQP